MRLAFKNIYLNTVMIEQKIQYDCPIQNKQQSSAPPDTDILSIMFLLLVITFGFADTD